MNLRSTFSTFGLTTCALMSGACGHEAKIEDSARVPAPAAPAPSSPVNTELPKAHSENSQTPAPQVSSSLASEKQVFRANITFDKGPIVSQESIACIEFFDFNSPDPVTVTDVTVIPWMSEHGHGAPTRNMKVVALNPFTYRITGLGFVMSGAWELQVSAMVNGKKDRIILPVAVP